MVTSTVLQVATGKSRSVPGLMWVVAAAFVGYFAIGPVTTFLEQVLS